MACSLCQKKALAQRQPPVTHRQNELLEYKLTITTGERALTKLRSLYDMTDTILRSTSVMLLGVIDKRIFVDNLLADGTPIKGGQGYSTKAALIDIRDIKMAQSAKTALKQIVGVKPDADQTFFWASYAQIREAAGLQTSHIDLQFSNQMRNDFIVFPDIATDTYGLGLRTTESANKMENLENRFGRIFQLTGQENLFVISSVEKYIEKILR